MAAIPFALSVHRFISTVGADAGFAAIIGLAILILLFFSQARETATLRRRAEDAEEALARLEGRLNGVLRAGSPTGAGAPVAAPPASAALAARPTAASAVARSVAAAPAVAGAQAVSEPGGAGAGAGAGVTMLPFAPAGVGAPALSSATRLIPLPDPGEISIRALRSGRGDNGTDAALAGDGGGTIVAPPASSPPAIAQSPTSGGSVPGPPADIVSAPPLPAGPPPSTAAGGANGSSLPAGGPQTQAVPAPLPAGGPQTQAVPAPLPAGGPQTQAAPAPRAAVRPQGAGVARPPFTPGPRAAEAPSRRWHPARVAILAAGLLAVAGVILVLVLVLAGSSGSSSTPTARRSPRLTTTGRSATANSVAVIPSSVTVAVLNGTSTTNLAHDVMAKLSAVGYKQGAISTASNQTLAATIVGYTQPSLRRDALAVAKSLGLAATRVQSVNASDRAVACSATPTSCPDDVIVTVGSDLNSLS